MKKFYFIAMAVILAMAVALISYGAYLNASDESQIQITMANRTIPLQGAKVSYRQIHPVFNLDAINLTSEDMADAVALIDGRIENSFVIKNSKVAKGQTLFELVNEDIPIKIQQVDSAIARAEAQVLQASNSFARYQRLKDYNATSMEKYDEAKLNFDAAQANLREVQAQKDQLLVQNARQNVTAPISGEVLILYKQIGAFVTAGTPIALIGNFERLNFSLPVEDAAAQTLTVGERFELHFKNSNAFQKAYDTEYGAGNLGNAQTFPVYIKEIIPALSEPATLRKVVFQVDNRAGILEQQTYNGVTLTRALAHNALAVPISAVAESDTVFIVNPDNTLQRRKVTTGAEDGTFVEIRSGVNEGDVVIISATKGLDDGAAVSVTLIGGDNNG